MAPSSTRTLWKGAISFGLVHIPVTLHPATAENRMKFNLLDNEAQEKPKPAASPRKAANHEDREEAPRTPRAAATRGTSASVSVKPRPRKKAA